MENIAKWKTIGTDFCGNYKVFDIYKKQREHPKTKVISEFTALSAPGWVNIIPITTNNEIILVEQYRHGIDDISLEIPAGIMEKNEEPRIAAERECKEETGYVGEGDAILLGTVRPNPAFLDNFCHHFLWKNCQLKLQQNLDENEDINVVKVPLSEIKNLIIEKKINHTLVLSAIFFFSLNNNI